MVRALADCGASGGNAQATLTLQVPAWKSVNLKYGRSSNSSRQLQIINELISYSTSEINRMAPQANNYSLVH